MVCNINKSISLISTVAALLSLATLVSAKENKTLNEFNHTLSQSNAIVQDVRDKFCTYKSRGAKAENSLKSYFAPENSVKSYAPKEKDWEAPVRYGYLTQASEMLAQRYPGTRFSCIEMSGVLAPKYDTAINVSRGTVLSTLFNSGTVGDSLIRQNIYDSKMAKISDTSGNFVAFDVVNERIYDVKLPFDASSGFSVLREKGILLGNNELIGLLNEWYSMQTNAQGTDINLYLASAGFLLNNAFREDFLRWVLNAKAQDTTKKIASNKQPTNQDDEIAQLKAELEALKAKQVADEEKPVKKTKKKKQ